MGAAMGAVVGAALAWLVSVQIVAIPDSEPRVAAGPMLAASAGAAAGGRHASLPSASQETPEYVTRETRK
jgi:hypothetical protein